jgi:hypothetical protein
MPSDVVAADFDMDGDIDLAVAADFNDWVSVFMNNGDGSFASRIEYVVGFQPYSVCASDLNADGWVDIVAQVVSDNTIAVLLNDGDGTFASAVSYNSCGNAYDVLAADLDDDGDMDIASCGVHYGDCVAIHPNNGDGSLASPIYINDGVYDTPWSLYAADVDGDGDNDLAYSHWGNYPQGVHVMVNEGDMTFVPDDSSYAYSGAVSVVASDVDGDDDVDLVSSDYSWWTFVDLNDGSGAFSRHDSYIAGNGAYRVYVADLDNDGDMDLATAGFEELCVSVLLSECDALIGDANGSGDIDIDDVVYIFEFIFGGPPPTPYYTASGDANCFCEVDIDDAVYLIAYIFSGGPPPCSCLSWVGLCGPLH